MANTTNWNQVKLTKENFIKTCWIEAEYAHPGWLVSLEENPDEIWQVSEVYSGMTSEKLKDQTRAQRVFDKKLDAKLKR